jgi:hypothetical protein
MIIEKLGYGPTRIYLDKPISYNKRRNMKIKEIKPCSKNKKNKNKTHQYNIHELQKQRLKDIEFLKRQPRPILTEINNIKNDYLNGSKDIITQAIELIIKELDKKTILDNFVSKKIQVSIGNNPTIEKNPKYVYKNKKITNILNDMSREIPLEDPNNQKMLAVKKILRYVQDKISWSLNGSIKNAAYYTAQNEKAKEESIFSDIADEELNAILGERRIIERQCGKSLPEKYNVSKLFENNLKKNIKKISNKKITYRKKEIKKLSKLFTITQNNNQKNILRNKDENQ